MTIDTPLEELAFRLLQDNAKYAHCAGVWINNYKVARDKVYELLKNVPEAEPGLTDHSETHVRDVFRRAYELLGEDCAEDMVGLEPGLLTPPDLMGLVCTILYHDVGNVTGRDSHEKKIVEVFTGTWPDAASHQGIRKIVRDAGGAHSGKAQDGSDDTLARIDPDTTGEYGETIQLRDIAAITRFADELAEGPQRTNAYMRAHKLIRAGSELHHCYSSVTRIRVDRGNHRIVLQYNIDLKTLSACTLRKLLRMAYGRIIKLNWERQLARHHCKPLSCFKQTEASFCFEKDGVPVNWDRETIVLNDISVGGHSPARDFVDQFERYRIPLVIRDLMTSDIGGR